MTDAIPESSLPTLTKPPITREQLRLYAEASGDNNPIHLDDEPARKSGLPGVIAHGMLTMAFMGEFLHQALDHVFDGKGRIEELSCRFKSMTLPGDVITVRGRLRERATHPGLEGADTAMILCDIETRNQRGETTASGHATLATEVHG